MNWLLRSFLGTAASIGFFGVLIAAVAGIVEMIDRAIFTGSYLWGAGAGMMFFLTIWFGVFVLGSHRQST